MADTDEILTLLICVFVCVTLIGSLVYINNRDERTVNSINALSTSIGLMESDTQNLVAENRAMLKQDGAIIRDIYATTTSLLSMANQPVAVESNDRCEYYELLAMSNTMVARD